MTTTEIYSVCEKIAAMPRRVRRLHLGKLAKKTGVSRFDLQDICELYIVANTGKNA
jgi:hypothetical protein